MAPGGSRIAAVRDETVIGGKTSRWSIKSCVVAGRLSSAITAEKPRTPRTRRRLKNRRKPRWPPVWTPVLAKMFRISATSIE